MTKNRPILNLRNSKVVLNEINKGCSVYLTGDSNDEFAIVEHSELDKIKSTLKLISKLEEGKESTIVNGWLSADEVEAILGI